MKGERTLFHCYVKMEVQVSHSNSFDTLLLEWRLERTPLMVSTGIVLVVTLLLLGDGESSNSTADLL